jgi:hypothetical protein
MKILHTADIQVKNRGENLYQSANNCLKQIEATVKSEKAEILIISGDLFEYAEPNDSERKLIYNFFSRLLNIKTLKELIVFAGNHDLIKDKKQLDSNIGFNPINVYADLIKNIESEDSDKLKKFRYFSESNLYQSNISNKIEYLVYSLEDDMKIPEYVQPNKDKLTICLFHDILKEYADISKLPLRKDIYSKLKSIEIFPENSLIAAGDIHKNLKYEGLNGQLFIYPGSPYQHTHSEGSYIFVGEKTKYEFAEEKVIKKYEVDISVEFPTTKDITISDLLLTDPISYITLTLDKNLKVDELLELVSKLELKFGTRQTFVNVKSCTSFLKQEQKISEILSEKISQTNTRFKIEFDYGKIVQVAQTTNNKVIQEIINEKLAQIEGEESFELNGEKSSAELEFDMFTNNFDKLILSEEHLLKLFNIVLDNALKGFENEDLTKNDIAEDVRALFNKEISELNTNSKKYDIVLEDIETTGYFMGMGPNKIELNIPGMVRILGTNKIGKTTLFRMIKWVISGETYEGMSKANVVKNNLVVFNKFVPDVDFVNVILNIKVNNLLITLTRTATRKWKNSTTPEMKARIDWKDYISTVERTFKVDITTQNGEFKTFTGEQAENSVKTWFGKTLNNILFLNQAKIENILNKSSDDLNELILEFIGVDYVKKLEANLPNVKTELNSTPKPKISKEDLNLKILDNTIFIKKNNEEFTQVEIEIETNQKEFEQLNINNTTEQSKLVTIGNIPNLITETKNKVSVIDEFLVNFVSKEIKGKIPFETPEPTNQNEVELATLKTEIELLRTKHTTNLDHILEHNKTKSSHVNEIVEVLNVIVERFETINTSILEDETKLVDSKNIQFVELLESVNDILIKLNNKKNEKLSLKNTYLVDILEKTKKIQENSEALKNGLCITCKKPLADDFESHKAQIELENNNLTKTLEDLKIQETEVNNLLLIIETAITKYNGFRDLIIAKDIDKLKLLPNFEDILKIGENQIQTIEESTLKLSEIKNKLNDNNVVMNFVLNFRDNFNNNTFDNIDFLNSNLTKLMEFEIFTPDIKETLDTKLVLKINQFKTVKINITEFETKNTEILSDIQKKENKISEIHEIFNNLLINYQKELNENIRLNNEIENENKLSQEHNNSKIHKELELNNLKLELNILETTKLQLYNEQSTICQKLNIEISEKQTTINELQNKFTNIKLKSQELEASKKELDKLYQEYLTYTKNAFVWKIYNKLIGNDFKEIIFEYYRTFLNNTLNILLDDVDFKLFWNNDSELFMVDYKNGITSYQPVQQSSGMETCFLGLALVYTIHLLNVKNTVSHIFVDEISGTLNKGDELSYSAENYQELFVRILNKFKNKTIFIVDHNIRNMFETATYIVEPNPNNFGSIYRMIT